VIVAVVWIVLIVGALILHARWRHAIAEWPRAHSPAPATRWAETHFPVGAAIAVCRMPLAPKSSAHQVPMTSSLCQLHRSEPGNPRSRRGTWTDSEGRRELPGRSGCHAERAPCPSGSALSVTRMAVLGPLSLAAPKRRRSRHDHDPSSICYQVTDGTGVVTRPRSSSPTAPRPTRQRTRFVRC